MAIVRRDMSSVPEGEDGPQAGLLKSADSLQIAMKRGKPPSLKQYPLSHEAKEGIRPIIEDSLQKGTLIPCQYPCHTPLLPVIKPKLGLDGKPVYKFVQDL